MCIRDRPCSTPTWPLGKSAPRRPTACKTSVVLAHQLAHGKEPFPRFRLPERLLEDVDGGVDDEPHHVYEVPVDARDLDAEVVLGLGPEVAAEGADRGEAEQGEADEDVGAVQAGEAEEDRAEGEVAGAEADVRVLVDLDEEEGRTEQQ